MGPRDDFASSGGRLLTPSFLCLRFWVQTEFKLKQPYRRFFEKRAMTPADMLYSNSLSFFIKKVPYPFEFASSTEFAGQID